MCPVVKDSRKRRRYMLLEVDGHVELATKGGRIRSRKGGLMDHGSFYSGRFSWRAGNTPHNPASHAMGLRFCPRPGGVGRDVRR